MSNIIYIVEGIRPEMTYWVTLKCFNSKKVAQAYCDYKTEYEANDCKYRVVEEEVI